MSWKFWKKKKAPTPSKSPCENLSAEDMQERYGYIAPMPPAILKLAEEYMAGKIDVDFENMKIIRKKP